MPRYNPDPPIVTLPSFKYVMEFRGVNEQAIINTLYFIQRAGATSVPGPSDVQTAADTLLVPLFRACLPTETALVKTTCYRYDDPTLVPTVVTRNSPGTVAGAALPAYVSIRIVRATNLAGQKGRGMIRLGGIPDSFDSNDKVAAAGTVPLDALIAGLETALTTANPTDGFLDPALLRRTFTLPPVVTAVVRGNVISDWDWMDILGSQRSRLMKGGT